MAHKVSTIVLKVDLECSRCNDKIRKVLCKYRERYQIQEEIYDEKNNTVTISGPFCPRKLPKKLCCKAGNAIKCIKIVDKKPPSPPPPSKPEPKPKPTPEPVCPPAQPIWVCCGPCYVGYGGGPCHEGYGRPQPCYCGCGGSQWTCYNGWGRPPQPCYCGCGGSQSTCYNGWGRPPQPCHCGCGGSQLQCSRRYGKSSYGSPCGLFIEEDPNSCIIM